jgi:hypothetical protein
MIELVKVEDPGGADVLVTFRMQRRLMRYLTQVLDGLFGVARQLHWRSRCAAADRRAFTRVWQIAGIPKEVNQVRDEMIVFLKDELGWSTAAIAGTYKLSRGTVRKVLSRRRHLKKPI